MRSGDKRMLEEINIIVCDHCSDLLFFYHDNYKEKLIRESINPKSIYVVGNTIKEVENKIELNKSKKNNKIILDIHRPENFNSKERLKNILNYANICSQRFGIPIEMLSFKRTIDKISEFNLDLENIKVIDLLSFKNYINEMYHSKFIISDSGTAQEEPCLFNTPVIVPRDFTERPESVEYGCSYMINVNELDVSWIDSFNYLSNYNSNTDWLGDGKTSDKIIEILKEKL
jgi:UDP-N-acetylglucosamine 2-epimerase (non-hydrolysing)